MKEHKPGEIKVYSINNPLVFTVDNMMPDEMITKFLNDIEKSPDPWKKAKVVDAEDPGGGGKEDYRRTNEHKSLHYSNSGAGQMFLAWASDIARVHPSQAEPLQVIKYSLGQEYAAHSDVFTPESLLKNVPQAGNRIMTALLYLTDVTEGGGTAFPNLDIEIQPKRGRCVFFSTTHQGTEKPIDLANHHACPVIRGEKIAVNLWFRSGIYDNNLYSEMVEKGNKLV